MKFVDSAVTFGEFPDEICLSLTISNCPNKCPGCHSAYLAQDIGTELTEELLSKLITKNKGITLVGFMGGDADHEEVRKFSNFVHEKFGLKVGMYSGRDYLNFDLAQILDYYKIGGWRPFTGPEETWKNQTAGPLSLPTSNQVMFKREGNHLINITDKFRKNVINNWKSSIM